jgi:general secretion pathway protein D
MKATWWIIWPVLGVVAFEANLRAQHAPNGTNSPVNTTSQSPAPRTHNRDASAPVALEPQDGQHTFHLHADKRSLVLQVLAAFGIQASLDDSVNAQYLHFDVDEVDFVEAADLLKLATNTFFVVLGPRSVIVIADTRENRARFQRLATRTFYFPGLDSKELTDMGNIAHSVFGAEQSAMESTKGTLTVRAPEPVLDALNEIYSELLVGRSVLELDVRLFEIDKTKATNVGIILPSSTTMFNIPSEINSILQNNASLVDALLKQYPSLAGNYEAILAALIASGALTGTVFNSPFAVFGGGLTETGLDLSGVSINMLLNSSDARSFKQQELRVLDQEDATIRSGERYPIELFNPDIQFLIEQHDSSDSIRGPWIDAESDTPCRIQRRSITQLGHETYVAGGR